MWKHLMSKLFSHIIYTHSLAYITLKKTLHLCKYWSALLHGFLLLLPLSWQFSFYFFNLLFFLFFYICLINKKFLDFGRFRMSRLNWCIEKVNYQPSDKISDENFFQTHLSLFFVCLFAAALPPVQSAPQNPCVPSPCGPNAQCQAHGESPSCSCLPGFIGVPPSCRPECISNSECPSHQACINQKCRDPCPGLCGANAECHVVSHTPRCVCLPGFVGDPFIQCTIQQCKLCFIFSFCDCYSMVNDCVWLWCIILLFYTDWTHLWCIVFLFFIDRTHLWFLVFLSFID